ncbi:hypothetical protein TSUD_315900 [Trifolium subterraneum]|uniref:Reverse transcriptase domain-containing protein n=1 Tax=Trifolium subterraneum TaxID=3900 RepID=A0A2Z6N5E9_TRISU|nr:hypothetical protein TSUD_315900 [Trifolium subterraneum]
MSGPTFEPDRLPLRFTVQSVRPAGSANEENWGPRPTRMLKCSKDIPALEVKGEDEVLSEAELEDLHGGGCKLNSQYFHSAIASRRSGSSIQVDGVATEGVQPIRQAVFAHFASHFKASVEVKSAIWDCDSYKSSGPDGINFGFIKDFWSELQADIMRFIAEFHRNGKLTKGLNSTFIALIPKVDCPRRLNDFQPISLVGSLYKFLAKVLTNRLRMVIGSVISESQTAFMKDRQILDRILIANEAVDEARRTKKELMLFKVDFEKAYDSVDWDYLDVVMGKMSFPVLWRKWIKECICTASASVLVNGSPTEEFSLERGLRQGDPLSPFLFLLAAEGLNVLMKTSWISWNTICLSKENEGLGVRRLREFNIALLGGRSGSSWWREIVRIRDGVEGLGGGWFGEGILKRVGDGTKTFFWTDPWLEGRRGSGRDSWAWEEEMLGECQSLLLDLFLQAQTPDRWIWQPDLARGYSVRGAYQLLTSHPLDPTVTALDLIWHKQVHVNVSILAWRLLRDRLPTKINLAIRGIITPEAQFCVMDWLVIGGSAKSG